jgi:hypothetical protein
MSLVNGLYTLKKASEGRNKTVYTSLTGICFSIACYRWTQIIAQLYSLGVIWILSVFLFNTPCLVAVVIACRRCLLFKGELPFIRWLVPTLGTCNVCLTALDICIQVMFYLHHPFVSVQLSSASFLLCFVTLGLFNRIISFLVYYALTRIRYSNVNDEKDIMKLKTRIYNLLMYSSLMTIGGFTLYGASEFTSQHFSIMAIVMIRVFLRFLFSLYFVTETQFQVYLTMLIELGVLDYVCHLGVALLQLFLNPSPLLIVIFLAKRSPTSETVCD